MASVAIPMIAGFVVNKVGESQGWDPRMTAVLGAAASFGTGSLYSAGTAVAASSAASSAANAGLASTATTGGMARGALGTQLAAKGLTGVGATNAAASIAAGGNVAPTFGPAGSVAAMPKYTPNPYPGLTDPSFSGAFGANKVNPVMSGPMYANAPVGLHKPITMGEAFGNEIEAWKTRPTDDQGKETGYSQAENFGVNALKTLMQPLPEEPPISSGGGGGGGPVAPAYQGGGGGGQYQTVWSFGQPNKGYKPQGI